MREEFERVLIAQAQIEQKVQELGARIAADYAGEPVIVACVLRGAFIFCADLVRATDLPMTIEFLAASSYGNESQSSGNVQIKRDFEADISGHHVLLVEDIVDSGRTLLRLKEMLLLRNPKSLKICALLDKPARRDVDLQVDYVGFDIPDAFAVGYGLDYAGRYRNLPDIRALSPWVYTNGH